MSASGLSDLGACPLRFLYGRVLDVYPPDDPVLDPERWLDNLQRGSLLHRVFERALRGARRDGIEPGEAAFLDRALEVLYDEAALALRTIPSPSDAVRLRELGRLADDVRSFVEMVRADDPDWVALELAFGFRGEAPMLIETPGGSVPLRGAVDRVDRRPDGLVVIDYKTGSTWQFGSKSGTYDGGRRLQHVLYSAVAAALLGEPVSAMEYHFPTRRGENRRAVFPMRRLRTAGELLDRLMDLMAGGHFLPTDDPDDCRFCNYQGACRVSVDRYNTVESPRAEWRKAHPDVPEARIHRRVRGWDDEGDGFLAAAGDAVPLAARRAPAEEVDPETGDPDAGSDPSDPSLPARGRP